METNTQGGLLFSVGNQRSIGYGGRETNGSITSSLDLLMLSSPSSLAKSLIESLVSDLTLSGYCLEIHATLALYANLTERPIDLRTAVASGLISDLLLWAWARTLGGTMVMLYKHGL